MLVLASWLMQPSSWRTRGDETIAMGDLPSVSSSLSSPPASWHCCGRFRLARLVLALPRGLRGVNVLLGRFLGASGASSWDSFGCFHGDLSARVAAFVQAEAGVRFADVGRVADAAFFFCKHCTRSVVNKNWIAAIVGNEHVVLLHGLEFGLEYGHIPSQFREKFG